MRSTYALHLGAQFVAGGVSLAVAYWVSRRADEPAGRYCTAMLVLGALWSILLGVQLLVPTAGMAELTIYGWQLVSWLFVPCWVLFVLHYTGRGYWLTPRLKTTMAALFGGGALLVLADPILGVTYTEFRVASQPFEHLVPVRGAGYWLLLAAGYAFFLWGYILLVQLFFRSRSVGRLQSATLLAAGFPPLVLSILRNLNVLLPRYDYTAIGVGLFSVLIAISLFRQRLLDVEPLARDIVVDAISDAVIVVDDELRIVDRNERASSLFPDLEDTLGDTLQTTVPELVASKTTTATFSEELTVSDEAENDQRTFTVAPTAITRRESIRGYVVVLQDVTELKSYARQLEDQTDHLDRVASTISHDLRNPLNVVLTTIELAEETGDTEQLYRARDAVDRMEDIIDDTLTLAREGRAIDECTFVSLAEVAREAWSVVESGDAMLITDTPQEYKVYADGDRLQRVFENLFRNAQEHGDASAVRLSVTEDGFFVADDGSGLPTESDDLFETGYSTATEGTGLGLSIVEAIATAHEWGVEGGESDPGGARFEFTDVVFTRPAGERITATGSAG
jgi:signal transduction histidine kinase